MDRLPRGPIYTDEHEGVDTPDKYSEAMRQWHEAAYEQALKDNALNPENKFIQRNLNYVQGQHWSNKRPRYKSRFYINKVGKARYDTLAHLTDSRPAIDVASNRADLEEAARVTKQCIESEWMRQDMDFALITAADIALAAGTAFWKVGGASPGSLKVTACGPDMVMPIQPGKHIQESSAVLYRTWKSLTDTMRKFKRAENLEREAMSPAINSDGMATYAKPGTIDDITWQRLAPQMRRALGHKVAVQEPSLDYFRVVEWQEYYVEDYSINESSKPVLMRDPTLPLREHNWWYWVQPKQRLYPRKRLITFAGKQLVYDGPAPFWHGLYPFATLQFNPVFHSFWGLSLYRDWIPVNSAMNDIVAGTIDTVRKALNPTVIAAQNAVPAAAWREFFPDMPGVKLQTNPQMDPEKAIRHIDPPKLPEYVGRMLTEFLGPEFDKLSGQIDVSALGGKMQVPGGDTIEQMRDSMQTGTRLQNKLLELFLRDAGVQAVSNVHQFFTVGRRMRMFGADGITIDDIEFNPKSLKIGGDQNKFDHWKQFSFKVLPGSLHSGSKDRDKMMAISLYQSGLLPRRKVLEILNFPDAAELEKELAERDQQMAAAGVNPSSGGAARLGREQRTGKL